MYQPEKLKVRRKELKMTQKVLAIKLIQHGNVE
jgi:DNA-binding XRE family transcriptional regulator